MLSLQDVLARLHCERKLSGLHQIISTMQQNNAFVDCDLLKGGCQVPGFTFHLVLCLYDYNRHVERLLPAKLA
jgi:hypothetical protein